MKYREKSRNKQRERKVVKNTDKAMDKFRYRDMETEISVGNLCKFQFFLLVTAGYQTSLSGNETQKERKRWRMRVKEKGEGKRE